MTKEYIFNLLDKAIHHISENFCSEERECYLDDELDGRLPFEYAIDSGISKAVILVKGAPFVIKIPFFKRFDDSCYQEDWDIWDEKREDAFAAFAKKKAQELGVEKYSLTRSDYVRIDEEFRKENPEPNDEDYDFYYDLEGASNIDLGPNADPAIPDWDYCRLESVIYQLAVEEGLGAYFAEEAYLGSIDNTPVYYQTRCIPMSEMGIDIGTPEYTKKEKYSRAVCADLKIPCFDAVWIADFLDLYGADELQRLNDFLDRYQIGDLRRCNIGYLDNAPILFDYSGYREW